MESNIWLYPQPPKTQTLCLRARSKHSSNLAIFLCSTWKGSWLFCSEGVIIVGSRKRGSVYQHSEKLGAIGLPTNFAFLAMFSNLVASSHHSSATDFNITRETSLHVVNLNTESVSSSLPACHWMLLLPMCLLVLSSILS